jgi:hypothetical protein
VNLAVIAGLDERVLAEVVGVAAVDGLRLAGIERAIVVHLERVVREEHGRGAPRGEREDEAGQCDDGEAGLLTRLAPRIPSRRHARTSK